MRTSFAGRGRRLDENLVAHFGNCALKCLRRDNINVAAVVEAEAEASWQSARLDSRLDSDSWFIKRIMPQDTLKLPARRAAAAAATVAARVCSPFSCGNCCPAATCSPLLLLALAMSSLELGAAAVAEAAAAIDYLTCFMRTASYAATGGALISACCCRCLCWPWLCLIVVVVCLVAVKQIAARRALRRKSAHKSKHINISIDSSNRSSGNICSNSSIDSRNNKLSHQQLPRLDVNINNNTHMQPKWAWHSCNTSQATTLRLHVQRELITANRLLRRRTRGKSAKQMHIYRHNCKWPKSENQQKKEKTAKPPKSTSEI